jgi:hypothetical protein
MISVVPLTLLVKAKQLNGSLERLIVGRCQLNQRNERIELSLTFATEKAF